MISDEIREDILILIANTIVRETRSDGNRKALNAADRVHVWLGSDAQEGWVPVGDEAIRDNDADTMLTVTDSRHLALYLHGGGGGFTLPDDRAICRCPTRPD